MRNCLKIGSILLILRIGVLTIFASGVNNQIQEAAYALAFGDTAKAQQLLNSAVNSPKATEREKLIANLYLTKIYGDVKNKIEIKLPLEQKKDSETQNKYRSNCIYEGELKIAQRLLYNCSDNSLHLISKKKEQEPWIIPYKDNPAKVFLIFDGFFLYSENRLYFYKLGENLNSTWQTFTWQIPTLEIQDLKEMPGKIFILDISGKISLLDKNSGATIASVKSDGENFFNPGASFVGTYQKNGGISVFDTLLTHLQDYQIYGDKVTKGDSALLAWFKTAEEKNIDSAWRKAVIYGARNKKLMPAIFSKYAEKNGAKWVKFVPFSSKMLYPQISADANNLFISDAGTNRQFKFSLEGGNYLGEEAIPKDEFSTVNMPGKAFSFLREKDSVYVGLWNGFVLKYFTPKMRLELSEKVSSAPVLLARGQRGVYALSQGKIILLSSESESYKVEQEGGIDYFKYKNSMFVVASAEGGIQVFSEADNFKPLGSFLSKAPIISLELLENNGKTFILAGGANQTLSLYDMQGELIWSFNSNGSAYMQGILHGQHIWLDQESSVVAIDVNTGKTVKKFPIFGDGASISIYNNTLYCITPQKLLYAFSLN